MGEGGPPRPCFLPRHLVEPLTRKAVISWCPGLHLLYSLPFICRSKKDKKKKKGKDKKDKKEKKGKKSKKQKKRHGSDSSDSSSSGGSELLDS